MKIQRRHITLLELLIATALTVVILSTLSYFYRQVTVINVEMDKTQNESFKKRYVENRLASVLPKSISSTDISNDFHFFSSPDLGALFKEGSDSLVFSFDNCVRLDKDMSYHVIGRLFLDTEGNLTLATWPVPKRWKEDEPIPISKEILLDHIETLEFQFYVPPQKTTRQEIIGNLPPEIRDRWEKRMEKRIP